MVERERYWEDRWTYEYYRAERLRAALQKIADLPAIDMAVPFRKAARQVAIDALRAQTGEKKDAENG